MKKFLVRKEVKEVVVKSIMIEAETEQRAAARALDPNDYQVQLLWNTTPYDSSKSCEKVTEICHMADIRDEDEETAYG